MVLQVTLQTPPDSEPRARVLNCEEVVYIPHSETTSLRTPNSEIDIPKAPESLFPEIEKPEPASPIAPAAKPAPSEKRGTRLPADWHPSADLINFGLSNGLSMAEVSTALDEFRDYWAGVPGTRGRKLDWPATFRNRLREVVGRKSRIRAPPKSRSELAVERRNNIIAEFFAENGVAL